MAQGVKIVDFQRKHKVGTDYTQDTSPEGRINSAICSLNSEGKRVINVSICVGSSNEPVRGSAVILWEK
jgi:hypothetical protein